MLNEPSKKLSAEDILLLPSKQSSSTLFKLQKYGSTLAPSLIAAPRTVRNIGDKGLRQATRAVDSSAQRAAATNDSEMTLLAGNHIVHPTRGHGVIVAVIAQDQRGKPYHIRFDSGEEHHYSFESAAKLRVLVKGTRVIHPRRGGGYVSEVHSEDSRGKLYTVTFDNGEVHQYSRTSATKLKVQDFEQDGTFTMTDRRTSCLQVGVC